MGLTMYFSVLFDINFIFICDHYPILYSINYTHAYNNYFTVSFSIVSSARVILFFAFIPALT